VFLLFKTAGTRSEKAQGNSASNGSGTKGRRGTLSFRKPERRGPASLYPHGPTAPTSSPTEQWQWKVKRFRRSIRFTVGSPKQEFIHKDGRLTPTSSAPGDQWSS